MTTKQKRTRRPALKVLENYITPNQNKECKFCG